MTSLTLAVVLQTAMLGGQNEQYMAAYARSVEAGRPLVVLLGADWCPGCRVMKGKVMPEVAKTGGLQGVEYVYVDIDRQRELGSRLSRAESIPQLICFIPTPDGWRRGMLTGAQSPQKVVAFLNAGRSQMAAAGDAASRLSSWKPSGAGQGQR
jgi:thiol-disulfide isomerase/thioredoxin